MGQLIRVMPSFEPALPEIRDRRCPYCRSDRIAPAGRVIGAAGMIKVQHRCEACRTGFLIVRKATV